MTSRHWLPLVALILTTASSAQQRPCFTVGRTAVAPVIDGRLSPGEWDTAAAVSGFVEAGAASLASPDTVVSACFDDRCLYFAFACAEPDRGRPRGYRRAHDQQVYEDDCVQVFIAPEDLDRAGQARINVGGYAGAYNNWYSDIKAYYEFTVSGCGSVSEARNDVRAWEAPWRAAVTRGDGVWSAELAIPFASLGISAAPREALWGLNLFRLRQPDATGWVFPGFGGYTPLPLGAMVLQASGPRARLSPPSLPHLGRNELSLQLINPSAEAVQVTAEAQGGEPIRTSVPPQGLVPLILPYSLAGTGALRADYSLRAAGTEAPLLAGTIPLPGPQPPGLTLRYYALPGLLEGTVQCGEQPAPARAVLLLDGREVQQEELAGKRGCRLRETIGGSAGETHAAQLRLLDATGGLLRTRSLGFTTAARPAWSGTKAGLPLGVLPPWSPLQVQGKTVRMLDKQFTFSDFALPAAVRTAGADLLAEPMRLLLETDGQPVHWETRTCRLARQSPEQVQVESVWRSRTCDLRMTSTLEYDGFSWNELRLVPHGAKTVNRLALEVPLRPDRARYYYAGHAQACGAISAYGLSRPLSQNLWIGDERRGLAFLAESLEWLHATDRGRQVQLAPGTRATLWRSTLIDSPLPLGEGYTAQFALHYTPAKPVPLTKSRIFHGAYYGMESAHGSGSIRLPTAGNLNFDRGTLEFFVKPDFDTEETYDPAVDRSNYNRQLLFLFSDAGGAGEILILYYNADDRTLRLVKRDAAGSYPLIFSSHAKLRPGAWNYVALSWGTKLRLCLNGAVDEREAQGAVAGDPAHGVLQWMLGQFAVDEIRLSRTERPLGEPPTLLAADSDTLFLDHCERPEPPAKAVGRPAEEGLVACEGRFGKGLSCNPETVVEQLAREGRRIVIFHENWSRYQGYPDLAQVPKLKAIADACHAHGLRFLIYFCQLMSDAAPEWPALGSDFLALPERMWYHRDDVKQDCYVSCVNGPYGDLLLDGIAKLADATGIDGVYMDGTTVPWDCANPSHAGCARYLGDGSYAARLPIRETRLFMKRLRNIFVQRGKQVFLDAHTGGAINIATQSFCDGYYDGETLARYKPGFRLAPDVFLTGYAGTQFGFRGEFLPNRHSADEALAISLVHDTATRGQSAAVDRAWGPYEDAETRYLPYWEHSPLYSVQPAEVLGSVYLKPDRALLVLGSQTEAAVTCRVGLRGVLKALPAGVRARDAITGEAVSLEGAALALPLPGRSWRMIELYR